jgi:hypothetical protein
VQSSQTEELSKYLVNSIDKLQKTNSCQNTGCQIRGEMTEMLDDKYVASRYASDQLARDQNYRNELYINRLSLPDACHFPSYVLVCK